MKELDFSALERLCGIEEPPVSEDEIDQDLQEENSGKYTDVDQLKECPYCGSSEDLFYRFIKCDNGSTQVRAICGLCGWCKNVQQRHNSARRTNTTLEHWSTNVKNRDGRECVICGSKQWVEAHHIIPVSHDRSKMYLEENGITLCKKCHYLAHHRPAKECSTMQF